MKPSDDLWAQHDEAIQRRVIAAIDDIPRVIYAAYPLDAAGLPHDNLDELAHPGPLQLIDPSTRQPWGPVLLAPTWLLLAQQAHQWIDAVYGFEQRTLVGLDLLGEHAGCSHAMLRLQAPQPA